MLIYAFRNIDGLFQDETHISIIEPILCGDNRYRVPVPFASVVSLDSRILNLEKGSIKTLRVENLYKLVLDSGGISPELESLILFDNGDTSFYKVNN